LSVFADATAFILPHAFRKWGWFEINVKGGIAKTIQPFDGRL